MKGSLRYLPGSAVAVVNGQTAVLLDVDPHDPLVTRIADLLSEGAGIDDVLDALVSTGLKTLADFGAFHVSDDGVRIVVRGKVGGSVGKRSGLHAEHTMWYDSWQPGESTAAVDLAATSSTEPLMIGVGVVLASAVLCGEPVHRVPEVPASPKPAPPKPAPVKPAPLKTAPVIEPANAAAAAQPVPSAVSPASAAAQPDVSTPQAATNDPVPELGGEAGVVTEAASAAAELEDSLEVDPGATMDAPLTISGEQLLAVSVAKEAEPPGLITGMPWAVADPAPAAFADPVAPPRPVSQPTVAFSVAPTPDPVSTPDPVPVAEPAPVPEPAPGAESAPIAEPAPVAQQVSADEPAPPSAAAPVLPQAQPEAAATPVVNHPALAGLVRPQPSPAAEVSADRTINRASLIGLPSVVMVVAARCSEGHLSPAYAGSCRVCRGSIPQQHPIEIPRPTLGQLRLSTGGVVSLDRPAILGRNPRVPQGYVGEQPNLVRLSDPDKDVSGQHLEVSLDYWNVMVCDLGSTNGTEVILPGEMPVVLRPNDPVIIEPGTRVVMAGSISFLFEVLP